MRDDNDYSSMGRQELRKHLERVTKEAAVWSQSASISRRDECLYYLDGVRNSMAKAITERKLEGEMHAGEFKREALESEGRVAYFTLLRDLLETLLETTEVD
jgi:hypothetical protein